MIDKTHYLHGFIHPRWLAGFLNHQQHCLMIIPGQTFTTMLKLLSAFHNISLYSRAMNFEALTPTGYSWYQLVCLNKKALKHFINWSPIKPNNLKSLILEFHFGKLWLWWCYLFYPFPLKRILPWNFRGWNELCGWRLPLQCSHVCLAVTLGVKWKLMEKIESFQILLPTALSSLWQGKVTYSLVFRWCVVQNCSSALLVFSKIF